MNIYLDLEANGLDPDVIHCVGLAIDDGPVLLLRTREQLEQVLCRCKGARLYAHNGIKYDFPVLTRVWGIDLDGFLLADSMVMAQFLNFSNAGSFSLDNLSRLVGEYKGSYDAGWEVYTDAMGAYCKQDVKALRAIVKRLEPEITGEGAIELEYMVQAEISKQLSRGWLLDVRKASTLLGGLVDRKMEVEDEVRTVFKPVAVPVKEVEPKTKKDGTLSAVGLKYLGERALDVVGGVHTRVDWQEFNLGSRQQIGERLIRAGWNPTDFTETGQPKVDETTLEGVDIPEAQLICEYLMLEKRIGMLNSWLEAADSEGVVRGRINICGARTHRMTHSNPNLAQVTSSRKPYGKEMRECWIARPGYKLVGWDAEGLELRMLAHYMADPEYAERVVTGSQEEGTDVHTTNQHAAGLPDRDAAKTFIYAFMYGAGDAKIGSIVGKGRAEGSRLKARFLQRTPALKSLKERVERAASRGYIKSLDGRHLITVEYKALNTLLQGGGSIVMKRALVILAEHVRKFELDVHFVGNIHDEVQAEVRPDDIPMYEECVHKAIKQAGEFYNLRVPMAAKVHVGDSWAETH